MGLIKNLKTKLAKDKHVLNPEQKKKCACSLLLKLMALFNNKPKSTSLSFLYWCLVMTGKVNEHKTDFQIIFDVHTNAVISLMNTDTVTRVISVVCLCLPVRIGSCPCSGFPAGQLQSLLRWQLPWRRLQRLRRRLRPQQAE